MILGSPLDTRPRSRLLAGVLVVCCSGLAACGGDAPGDTAAVAAACSERPGDICTIAGVGGEFGRGFNGDDLPARETMFALPTDLLFDAEGRLVIADYNNQRVRRLEPDGTIVTIAGNGLHLPAALGVPATETGFDNPMDLALSADGTLYLTENHASRVVSLDPDGVVQLVAGDGNDGYGGDDGPAILAQLYEMVGIALGDDGTLYIADTLNHVIRGVTAGPVPLEGYDFEARMIWTVAGTGEPGMLDGDAETAMFNRPQHLDEHDGWLYIADAYNHRICKIELATGAVQTVAGTGVAGYTGDGGLAVSSQLREPSSVLVEDDGTILFTERGNNLVRHIGADGTLATIAGTYVQWADSLPEGAFDGDGGPAVEARLHWPESVTVGPDGHLYVADMMNSAIRVIYR